jgi:hypothetical protein
MNGMKSTLELPGTRTMKRIKHNDLTHYFLADHKDLPGAYLASCEKFFRAGREDAEMYKRQASSSKPQASSLTEPGPDDSNRIIKEN